MPLAPHIRAWRSRVTTTFADSLDGPGYFDHHEFVVQLAQLALPDHGRDVAQFELGNTRNEGPADLAPQPIPLDMVLERAKVTVVPTLASMRSTYQSQKAEKQTEMTSLPYR